MTPEASPKASPGLRHGHQLIQGMADGGFQLGKWATPNSWMVFVNGKIPSFEMDDDLGVAPF